MPGWRVGASTWVLQFPFDPSGGPELVRRMVTAGCGHIEFGGDAVGLDPPVLADICAVLDAAKVTSSVCGLFSSERDLSSEDAGVRAAAHHHLDECLQLASSLGSYIVVGAVCGTGGRTRLDPAIAAMRRGIGAAELDSATERIRQHGVKLGVEPLNRYENNLLNTVEHVLMVVDELDPAVIGVHLDVFHANIEEISIPAAILTAGARLQHLHAVSNQRGSPGDAGHLPWPEIARALHAVRYDGSLVVEAVAPESALAEPACVWRPVKESQQALLEDAMTFLSRLGS